MSLEDLDFQSDESDYEDGKSLSSEDDDDDDDEESIFLELFDLFNMLKHFEYIYYNNTIMDLLDMRNAGRPSFESDSEDSDLNLLQEYIGFILGDMSSTMSSLSSSVTSQGDGPTSETDESLSSFGDLVQPYEEIVPTSSSSSPDDLDDVD